jgi:hypothetical protein
MLNNIVISMNSVRLVHYESYLPAVVPTARRQVSAAVRSAFQAERDRVQLQQQRNGLSAGPLGGIFLYKRIFKVVIKYFTNSLTHHNI